MASLLGDVVAHLHRKRVPFALIGATALASHGLARATFDIDLITLARDVLSREFWNPLQGEIDPRRGDFDDPLIGVVRINREGERQLDIVIPRGKYVRGVIERAEPAVLAGVTLPVARLADIVLLKLDAGGVQDRSDIERILANAPPALISEIEDRLPELPADAAGLWARIRAQ